MALEGQLSDFSLEEILQLIAVQQKSGFLVLKHDQDMVFYFDHGALVSVRDRRAPGNDPLGPFLRRYGYLKDEQWTHVEYVLSQASLDLAEVLVSENILDEKELLSAMQALAQEMIHQGMQLKRGGYHFTATPEVQTGLRGRLSMDIQGLLMEGARRLDEEPRLQAALPSAAMTFGHGSRSAEPGELPEISARVLKLALAGKSLGDVIAAARATAFTTRECLKNLCEMGLLTPVKTGMAEIVQLPVDHASARGHAAELRYPVPTVVLALAVLLLGAFRWAPALSPVAADQAELASARAPGTSSAGAVAAPSGGPGELTAADFRLHQLADEADQAILLHRLGNGRYPADLATLVADGSLDPATPRTLASAGWAYQTTSRGDAYTLGR